MTAHGAPGHGPKHLLMIAAAEIGFVLDGARQVGASPAEDAWWILFSIFRVLSLKHGSAVLRMVMGTFGATLLFPFFQIWDQPEFLPLLGHDWRTWPRWFLWSGLLPGLSGWRGSTPWAASLVNLFSGSYFLDISQLSAPPEGWDSDDIALEVDEHHCVWNDGSAEVTNLAGGTVAVAEMYLLALSWVMPEDYGDVAQDTIPPKMMTDFTIAFSTKKTNP